MTSTDPGAGSLAPPLRSAAPTRSDRSLSTKVRQSVIEFSVARVRSDDRSRGWESLTRLRSSAFLNRIANGLSLLVRFGGSHLETTTARGHLRSHPTRPRAI